MITIDELMTSDPYTLRETDTLEDARRLMTEKHIRHIPITDVDHHLAGLITQRDVLEATDPGANRSDQASRHIDIKLADIMIKKVSVIHKNDSVRRAAIHLQEHKYGCLPVVVDNQLVGIITDSDFIGVAINLLEQVEISEAEIDYEPDEMEDVEMPVPDENL